MFNVGKCGGAYKVSGKEKRKKNSIIVTDEMILSTHNYLTHLVYLSIASTAYLASIAPRQRELHAQYHQPSSPA